MFSYRLITISTVLHWFILKKFNAGIEFKNMEQKPKRKKMTPQVRQKHMWLNS